jgi:uracil-DNA glycosylase family 4
MAPDPPAEATADRVARQHLETLALLGVDFVPVRAGAGGASPAPVPASAPGPDAADPAPRGASAGERLAALRERYEREATVPRTMPGWSSIVFGDGDPDARLMFIGEAPGADEDAEGVPFVGRAGQKLNEMIRAMGLSRESVYISNVLKVRPPNNRTPTPEEVQADGPWLLEQIRIVAPEVIVSLGRPAAHFLLHTSASMGSLRGTWAEHEGVPVMPTYHPAYLLRAYTPENRRKVWSDLRQVMDRLGLE